MNPTDTIAAVASGWGRSRWALVRISGPAVPELLADLLRPAPSAGGTIARASLMLSQTHVLPVLVMRSDAPRSFTGEHTAELLVPGNPLILERVLARLSAFRPRAADIESSRVREAEPGEFSARAYLNGKLTLDQAEGVAATIAADSDAQLAAAEALMSGTTGHIYASWIDEVSRLLALVEAGIDFTDQEDVVPIPPIDLHRALVGLARTVGQHLGSEQAGEEPEHFPRAVLVGPPNAGKSTLFNALLGRRRAVVSPVAGTTRDPLVEMLRLDQPGHPDLAVLLVDLPGLDVAPADAIDAEAQARARRELARADILISCHPHGRHDRMEGLPARPTIRIRTKADLPSPGAEPAGEALSIPVCALDGWNLPALRRALADAACGGRAGAEGYILPRHRRMLVAGVAHLTAAVELVDPAARSLGAPEMIATELRAALDALTELTGRIPPDEIIGRIFATFCIGK